MDCKKKLSIIIPVYKTEKYLKKCLDSVLAATDEGMEVLIINDGSPDRSEEIALEYVKQQPEVFFYFKKENGGLSDVKNFGLGKARGEYVIFLDSDDFIEADMYREMLNAAEEESADVVVCDVVLDYEEPHVNAKVIPCVGSAGDTDYERLFGTWLMSSSWNKMVRKELYDGLLFPKGLNNEDIAVTPIVLARAERITILREPYYHYLQRKGSIQSGDFNEQRFVILETVCLALEHSAEIDAKRAHILRKSLYEHQLLETMMYPIRKLSNQKERVRVLAAFMEQVSQRFPDFMDVIAERVYQNPAKALYRKIMIYLLGKGRYQMLCRFWDITFWLLKK